MWGRRAEGRATSRRAFQPTIDGRLEPRFLLTTIRPLVKPGNYPSGAPNAIYTAANGHAVVITNPRGQSFYINTATSTGAAPTAANPSSQTETASSATIRAYRMSGGRFGLIIDGSGVDTDVLINPLNDPRLIGSAHTYNTRQGRYNNLLNIGAVTVTSGTINSILGYRTAILSGPISIPSPNRVDRIAFDTIAPGASIAVGGDINSLDVLNSVVLSGQGNGIVIGRDLNELTVGGDLVINNGAVFSIGRDQGLVPQIAKGSAPQPQALFQLTANQSTLAAIPTATASIYGSLVVAPGSAFNIVRAMQGYFIVNGTTIGTANIHVGFNEAAYFVSRGGFA